MSESYREQHPLLYEDLSEEEHFSPRYPKRLRPMVYKGRAKNNVKGAAAIIRLWPEHWSSSVTYWWIALGMLGLITIIVYNSVVVFAMLPPEHFKETRPSTANKMKAINNEPQFSFNIYMHLFVENNQEVDLNNYMPYIDIIANKYSDFKYHLIIVFNDTSVESNNMSAEESNDIALNLLWAKNSVHQSQSNNVVIEHVMLSKYMNNSPLRQYWRKLPKQFIQFLTRAVSIWDKGGVAFNPTILTPRSPHAVYIEKIQSILKNYHKTAKKNVLERKTVKKPHILGTKKRVNNIRDIIDALEHEDEASYGMSDSLTDEELNHKLREKNSNDTVIHKSITNDTTGHQIIHPKFRNLIKNKSMVDAKHPNNKEMLVMAESKVNNVSVELQENNDTSPVGILPMFLEFLFRNKSPYLDSSTAHEKHTTASRKRKHAPLIKSYMDQYSDHADKNVNENLKPVDVSAKAILDPEKVIEGSKGKTDEGKFTIDLKGNIVSSEIPCHAFLGTMFSNAGHHVQESLTDFIITELSIFCKGALSSCKGIDVILL